LLVMSRSIGVKGWIGCYATTREGAASNEEGKREKGEAGAEDDFVAVIAGRF
jgi:hypothetical protein